MKVWRVKFKNARVSVRRARSKRTLLKQFTIAEKLDIVNIEEVRLSFV